jgi:hypothetical protein
MMMLKMYAYTKDGVLGFDMSSTKKCSAHSAPL